MRAAQLTLLAPECRAVESEVTAAAGRGRVTLARRTRLAEPAGPAGRLEALATAVAEPEKRAA